MEEHHGDYRSTGHSSAILQFSMHARIILWSPSILQSENTCTIIACYNNIFSHTNPDLPSALKHACNAGYSSL